MASLVKKGTIVGVTAYVGDTLVAEDVTITAHFSNKVELKPLRLVQNTDLSKNLLNISSTLLPECPKPPSPRSVSFNLSTSSISTSTFSINAIWPILS